MLELHQRKQKAMKNSLLAAIAMLLALSGCKPECKWKTETDKAVYREVFLSCLEKAAKPPNTTHYNDEDEVVGECRQSAYSIATESEYVCPKGEQ